MDDTLFSPPVTLFDRYLQLHDVCFHRPVVRDDELLYPYDHVRILRTASSSRSSASICATVDHLPSTRSNDRRLHCQCRCFPLQTTRTKVCDHGHEYRSVVGFVCQLSHHVCSLLLHVLHATGSDEQGQRSRRLRIFDGTQLVFDSARKFVRSERADKSRCLLFCSLCIWFFCFGIE